MEESTTKPMPQDHDLLIRLDQKVDNLTTTIDKLSDSTAQRVSDLEHSRVTNPDYNAYVAIATKKSDDLEKRMRANERFIYVALGVITVVELIGVPLIIKYLLK